MQKGNRTREEILSRAFELASIDGLEGLSIGSLAAAVGMSKSGLFAHFKSKENLQCSVIDWTAERFTREVLAPALMEPRGVARIKAFFKNWITWHRSSTKPGGCVMIAACSEFDDRPGAVQTLLLKYQRELVETLSRMAAGAVEQGQFAAEVKPEQFAFELYGAMLGFHHYSRLLQDQQAIKKLQYAVDDLVQRSQRKGEAHAQ